MTVVVILLTIVVAVLCLLVAGLLRSHATILRRLHELGAGVEQAPAADTVSTADLGLPRPTMDAKARPAADLVGRGPRGEAVAVRVVGTRHDTVLAFLSSGCNTCHAFWEQLADAQLPANTRLVIVTKGEDDESSVAIADVAPAGETVVMSSEAWQAYAIPGSPYVVHVDGATGRVRGEGTGPDWQQVRRMLLTGAGDLDARRPRGVAASPAGKAAADARREQDVDLVLEAAGIRPGDPSLYRRADGTLVEPQ